MSKIDDTNVQKLGWNEIAICSLAAFPVLALRAWVISYVWNTSTTVHLYTMSTALVASLLIVIGIVRPPPSNIYNKKNDLFNLVMNQIFGALITLTIVWVIHMLGFLLP